MKRDPGCEEHGWAFDPTCPGCDEADDRDIARELRWAMFRTRWFPYRTAEFLGVKNEVELDLGPWRWNTPDRLAPFWRPIVKFLNRDFERKQAEHILANTWHCTLEDREAQVAEWNELWERVERLEAALREIAERHLRPCGVHEAPLPDDVALAEIHAIARAALEARP